MAKEAPMTPDEVTALKAEVTKTVDSTIKEGMTRTDAVKAVCDAVETMEAPKDLGGLGDLSGGPMDLPPADGTGPDGEEILNH